MEGRRTAVNSFYVACLAILEDVQGLVIVRRTLRRVLDIPIIVEWWTVVGDVVRQVPVVIVAYHSDIFIGVAVLAADVGHSWGRHSFESKGEFVE